MSMNVDEDEKKNGHTFPFRQQPRIHAEHYHEEHEYTSNNYSLARIQGTDAEAAHC
jgi:hypothetical protein